MSRALQILSLACVALFAACHEEPTIVIKFEPNDMSGAKSADLAPRSVAADLAMAPPTSGKPVAKTAECKVAADCVVEPIDCCDCANGGKQHAVSKKVAAAGKSARAEKCKTAVCTMMLSTDPSCGQRADCVKGACVMVKKK